MKAALVLSFDSNSLQQQVHEINAMLNHTGTQFSNVELWLFYKDRKPEFSPEIFCPLSGIKLIQVEYVHLPESYLDLLVALMGQCPMDLLLFTSDGLGQELATRLAYRLNGSSALKVEDCRLIRDTLEVIKPVYGNNLSARFVLKSSPYCLSVAKQPFHPVKMILMELLKIKTILLNQTQPWWVKEHLTILDPPKTGLSNTDLVLVVGQGAGNKKTVDVLKGIADTIGAEIGGSRPAVMNAWIDINRLIGASGLIISPKLCIAAGVSGTGVFSVGIKNSRFIVAINIDSKAPIFQIADVGIVGDLATILLELEKVILTDKNKKQVHHIVESRIETQ